MLTMTKMFENKGLILLVALIGVSLVLLPAGAAVAGGRGHGGHWGGHGGGHGGYWGGGWGWYGFGLGVATGALLSYPYYYQPYYPYYSRAYYYPYRYAPATQMIVRERTYTREPGYSAGDTWYFCRAANAYYPYVRSCAGGWEKVPAVPPSSAPEYGR